MKSKHSIFLLTVLVMFLIMGCAQTTWQAKGTAIYTGVGTTLKQADTTFQELKAANLVTAVQVTQYNELYKKAYNAYWTAGDAWKLALKAGSDIEQGNYIAAFYKNISEFQTVVADIIALVNGIAVKQGGAK